MDDFQPQVQIKKALADGTLSLQNEKSIREFCCKFIVERDLLTKCVEHIQINEIKKAQRIKERKAYLEAEASKEYEDFDWFNLKDSDEIRTLKVDTLNKYIFHPNIKGIIKFKKN